MNSINQVIIKHAKFAEEVLAKTSVQDALDYLKWSKASGEIPEVIFLDLNMPEMDGWDFIDAFKKLNLSDTKVVILTSSISANDKNKAHSYSEISAYIAKPLSPEVLEEVYAEHL